MSEKYHEYRAKNKTILGCNLSILFFLLMAGGTLKLFASGALFLRKKQRWETVPFCRSLTFMWHQIRALRVLSEESNHSGVDFAI